MHHTSEAVFVSPQSLGYIRNRNQVAGFQSHAFSYAPQLLSFFDRPWYRKEKEIWAIHRLELVSLLKHDKPLVYTSRNLPRMKDLANHNAKTRELDKFEHGSLRQLRNGEDVVTSGALNRIVMLGSLRATKNCMQCHDVEKGALLGAFSYEFLRDPQIREDKQKNRVPLKPVF